MALIPDRSRCWSLGPRGRVESRAAPGPGEGGDDARDALGSGHGEAAARGKALSGYGGWATRSTMSDKLATETSAAWALGPTTALSLAPAAKASASTERVQEACPTASPRSRATDGESAQQLGACPVEALDRVAAG